MREAEFDSFADEYDAQHRQNIALTGEDPSFFAAYKIRLFAETIGAAAGSILDFGSGIGNSIPHFRTHLPRADLTCADVSEKSSALARARFPGRERYLPIEGDRIPAPDASFDAAFSACVFHHIPHEEHVGWLGELLRVTRPGGRLMIFEHNPLNPLTVRAVNTCPFDANARLISARRLSAAFREAGWNEPRIRYHVFFPRALARLRPLEPALAWCSLGAQYSVEAVRSG